MIGLIILTEKLLTLFLFHFPWLLCNSNEKLVKFGLTLLPVWHFMETNFAFVSGWCDGARRKRKTRLIVVLKCVSCFWFNFEKPTLTLSAWCKSCYSIHLGWGHFLRVARHCAFSHAVNNSFVGFPQFLAPINIFASVGLP